MGLLHEQLQLVHQLVASGAHPAVAQGGVVAADDLLPGRGAHSLVVHDALARHVHPHVGGGLVGALPHDPLKHGGEDGEDLHVPVVVHRGFAVGGQVEGVDHVHIPQIGGGRLIGQVHRVLEGQVPDGEGLKLGVARLDPPLVVVVELGEADGHLAAAGAGGRHHHQGTAGLDIVVFAVAPVADNQAGVVGVACDGVVEAGLHPQVLHPAAEGVGGGLSGVLGDHHAAHQQALPPEGVDEPQHVHVVGDAQIAPDLVLLDVAGADGDDHLHRVPQLLEHTDLAVRLEPGQHPGCVVVVKELAAELQIELVAELADPLPDVGRLELQILLIVKAELVHLSHPLLSFIQSVILPHPPSPSKPFFPFRQN